MMDITAQPLGLALSGQSGQYLAVLYLKGLEAIGGTWDPVGSVGLSLLGAYRIWKGGRWD